MTKKRILLFFLIISAAYNSFADTIHIVYPEGSSTYQGLAKKLGQKIESWQKANSNLRDTIHISNSQFFSMDKVAKNDLIIDINTPVITEQKNANQPISILSTFYTSHKLKPKSNKPTNINQSYIHIDQPIVRMIKVAKKTIKSDYKNQILIIISEKNKSALEQLKKIKKDSQIKILIIKEGDIAAKIIEKDFFNAGAIIAIYDPTIWSGNSARWLLQQAYNYKVPVIGYSKAFLKAGAMISVYSTADQILEETYTRTISWIERGKKKPTKIHPEYTIEVNHNIAKALNFSDMEIIEMGKKQ